MNKAFLIALFFILTASIEARENRFTKMFDDADKAFTEMQKAKKETKVKKNRFTKILEQLNK